MNIHRACTVAAIALCMITPPAWPRAAPEVDHRVERILGAAMASSGAHDFLRRLTDSIGGRVTGSPQSRATADLLLVTLSQAQDNIVEYNHVHDIGQGMLSDLAGSYTCSTPGTRIRHNLVHDVSRRNYGGWGIYPDEGSHDMLIQNNLVYRCQDGALFAHHNHNITAENYIFAFNRKAQIERGGIGGFELTCRRNLVYYDVGKAIGDYGSRHGGRDVCTFDQNLYWNASGKPVLFGRKSLAEWQAMGQDKDSLIADPLFVDPTKGDFRLRHGSPAARIGFKPWDLSPVGPRSVEAK